MSSLVRLDRFLSEMGVGTRSEVKKKIGFGKVTVNGKAVRKPETKVNPETDEIIYKGVLVEYKKNVYYMLNKPQGYVCANEDKREKTVLELFSGVSRKNLFCAGRLDKDTVGLLLVTDDGNFSHKLMSPKKKVPKCYEAMVTGILTEDDVLRCKEGIAIEEDFTTSPAELSILSTDSSTGCSLARLTIYEGKFHQVKRMFEKLGKNVETLKRISIGSLSLDETLAEGEFRELTAEEIQLLQS